MSDQESTQLADPLVKSIVDEVLDDDQLNRLDSFSELHDFCDANTLGKTEWFFNTHGAEVVEKAQQIVDSLMPIVMACRYCGKRCESGDCGCCDS